MDKKLFLTAQEVADILGISKSAAYKIIAGLNKELKERGFYTVCGKVNRRFFEEKCLYGCAS